MLWGGGKVLPLAVCFLLQMLHHCYTYYAKNPNFLKSEQIQRLEFKARPDFKKTNISERQELIKRICENIWSVNYFNK